MWFIRAPAGLNCGSETIGNAATYHRQMLALDLMLAIAGLGLVLGAWLHYFSRVPSGRLSGWPITDMIVMAIGMVCALAGALLGPMTSGGGGWSIAGLALGSVSLSMGGIFFWLLSIARLPANQRAALVVSVGDPLPAFSAWDYRGERFTWDSLAGERVLLKFFRGHW